MLDMPNRTVSKPTSGDRMHTLSCKLDHAVKAWKCGHRGLSLRARLLGRGGKWVHGMPNRDIQAVTWHGRLHAVRRDKTGECSAG